MSTTTPSRNLDELTTEQPNDKTCNAHKVGRVVVGGVTVEATRITPDCGAPATHTVFSTCCGRQITHVCIDHSVPFGGGHGFSALCAACLHQCVRGECYHRIVTPL